MFNVAKPTRPTRAALWFTLAAVPWSALLALPALLAGGCETEAATKPQSAPKVVAVAPAEPAPAPMPAFTRTAPREQLSPLEKPAAVEPFLPPATPKPEDSKTTDIDGAEAEAWHVPAVEDVQLERFVLSRGVEDREPTEPEDVFTTDDERIYAFMHLANQDGEPYQLTVHFEPVEGPSNPYGVTLNVESSARWRTWAFTRIKREPGMYRCVIRNADGDEVAQRVFEIVDADAF